MPAAAAAGAESDELDAPRYGATRSHTTSGVMRVADWTIENRKPSSDSKLCSGRHSSNCASIHTQLA